MERMMDGMNGGLGTTAPMPDMGATDGGGALARPRPKRSSRPKAAKKPARKAAGKKRAKTKTRAKARKSGGAKRPKKRGRRR